MRWLNPWALLGLMTIAVPVLVHLFSRMPARTMPFPTLRFLSDSRLLPTRRTRLSDVPLLAVRIAILALAALALSQPLFSSSERTPPPRNDLARAIIIQTDPSRAALDDNSGTPPPLEQALALLEDRSATHLRIPAASPHAALSGAVAWLRTQPGVGEIVFVSDGTTDALEHTLDSTDVASIPADLGVSFVQVPAAVIADASIRARVLWITDAPSVASDAVRRAVVGIAGRNSAEVRVVGAQTAFVDTVRAQASDSIRTLVIVTADSPQLATGAAWQSTAPTPWIGATIVAMARDSTVGSTAATVSGGAVSGAVDPVIAAGTTVVARDAGGAPLSVARAVRAGTSAPLLLVISRTPATHVHAAALLLASSRLLGRPSPTVASGEASIAAFKSRQRAWSRAPIARSDVSARVLADTDSRESLGRWLWLGVLVLLFGEWLLRRRMTSSATAVPATGSP